VVVLDNKLKDLGNKDISNLNNFITTSSSSDNDKDNNVSDDKEYSYKGHDEVNNKEEGCKGLEEDKEAKLGA